MTRVLAIDTSGGSAVALVGDGETYRATVADPRSHAEHLAGLVRHVTDGHPTPEVVAVGTGPAPFTGLRIGLVTAEAYAFARGLPVLGVPSLDAIARSALDTGGDVVTVVTDARRKEIYAASYAANGADDVTRLGDFYVGPAADLIVPEGTRFVGSATSLYPEVAGEELTVDAVVLARIALARAQVGLDQPTTPLYLRRPDAQVPQGRGRA